MKKEWMNPELSELDIKNTEHRHHGQNDDEDLISGGEDNKLDSTNKKPGKDHNNKNPGGDGEHRHH